MKRILCCKVLSLCLGLMAFFAKLTRGIAFLPSMVASYAIVLQIHMLLMVEFCLAIRIVDNHHIFLSKSYCNHQDGEQKTYKNPNANQTLSHRFFTPFPLYLLVLQLIRPKESIKYSFFVKKKIRVFQDQQVGLVQN